MVRQIRLAPVVHGVYDGTHGLAQIGERVDDRRVDPLADLPQDYPVPSRPRSDSVRTLELMPGMVLLKSENLFGSTINATLNFQFNRNVSWYSRFYYNTSYKRIEGEWENRFTFAWSRFFSTNITLNLRYDDGVAKNEDFDSYLQINELLSFGFNYKW